MTLDAMTFAHDGFLIHQLTDEYAAALLALERGEPNARTRVMKACAHVLAHERDGMPHRG